MHQLPQPPRRATRTTWVLLRYLRRPVPPLQAYLRYPNLEAARPTPLRYQLLNPPLNNQSPNNPRRLQLMSSQNLSQRQRPCLFLRSRPSDPRLPGSKLQCPRLQPRQSPNEQMAQPTVSNLPSKRRSPSTTCQHRCRILLIHMRHPENAHIIPLRHQLCA